jgi:uncharacterized OB-fold protein
MPDLPDYMRLNESQESLFAMLRSQRLEGAVCPSCGSLFVLHICHANPGKGKGMAEAKPRPRKIKGVSASYMVLDDMVVDEIVDWDEMSLAERRIKES